MYESIKSDIENLKQKTKSDLLDLYLELGLQSDDINDSVSWLLLTVENLQNTVEKLSEEYNSFKKEVCNKGLLECPEIVALPKVKKVNSNSKNIAIEIELYNKNPIEYMLTHYEEAVLAYIALKNLEPQSHLIELLPEILKVENCLEAQPEGIIEDLNAICVENGSYYNSLEL
jgi:hypothetical protein